jgi:hypothetical protein
VDFVTHACVGALVGRALGGRRAGRAALVGALAALAPDVDHVLEWRGAADYLLFHRTATHSLALAGAAGLAVSAAGGARRGAIVLAAVLSHLLLDALTPFGTALFWPFSGRFFAWDGLPIVCPWLAGLSVLLLAAARRRSAACAALAAIGIFVAGEWLIARRAAPPPRPGIAALTVPDWRLPWRAASVAMPAPAVPPAAAPLVARFRVPALAEEGGALVFRDAQFDLVDPARPPFRVIVGPAGTHVEQRALGLQPVLWFGVAAATIVAGMRGKTSDRARRP